MKFGINTQIWTYPFSNSDFNLINKAKKMGFDVIEITLDEFEPHFDVNQMRRRLEDNEMEIAVDSTLDSSRDITSEDAKIRQKGKDFIKSCIENCHKIGAKILCGPLYAEVMRTRKVPFEVKKKEWQRCVDSLKEVSEFAKQAQVIIAVEPLNRFETDFLNTAEQGLKLIRDINSPQVKLHLDTFHMNIEELNIGESIRMVGKDLYHFHACENNRGIPGTGHIEWQEVALALSDIGYEGYITIESFSWEKENRANFGHIWYPLTQDPDSIAKEGLKFLKKLFTQVNK